MTPATSCKSAWHFWPSKILLSAVELGLFAALGDESLTGSELAASLELRSRALYDFLDGLVALGLLERDGAGPDAQYRNTPETAAYKPEYIGGVLEMSNARLYRFWGTSFDLPVVEPIAARAIEHAGLADCVSTAVTSAGRTCSA